MTIARIQVDISMLDDEKLEDLMTLVGDLIVPHLDPHDDDEPCVRYVSIVAAEMSDDEYEIGFDADEEEELIGIGVPQMFRDAADNN